MRVTIAVLAVATSVPAIAAGPAASQTKAAPGGSSATECRRTTSYVANEGSPGLYRGRPLAPQKLAELPPATAYMAVYRRIGGCEAPLTMVDYRNPRRR
jgi:hypothetical protein